MDNLKQINSKHMKVYQIKKEKRYRSAFTTDQIKCLEKEFKKSPYIGVANRKELANIVHIPERAIKIWFQNRRMKEKKCVSEKEVNIDDQNKPNELYAKDLLTNVHTSKSVNGRHHHLQTLLTSHNERSTKVNSKKYDIYNELKEKNNPYYKISENKDSHNDLKHFDDVYNAKRGINFNKNVCYGFQSKINNVDSRKYYANKKTTSTNDNNNLLFRDYRIKNILPTQSTSKRQHETESKKTLQNQSLHIKKNVYQQQQHQMANLDSFYVPVNIQNKQSVSYSLLGDALNKPANLPLIVEKGNSRPTPRVTPDVKAPFINQTEKKCSCTCHADKYYQTGRAPYILAIPLTHFDNKNERNCAT